MPIGDGEEDTRLHCQHKSEMRRGSPGCHEEGVEYLSSWRGPGSALYIRQGLYMDIFIYKMGSPLEDKAAATMARTGVIYGGPGC